MRILHTADWHLGDRLGRQDRTDDLRRAVERVADYCTSEKVDVLLAAGDLFSELAPPEGLRDAIRHLQETFGGFLAGGGSILALTGNHDKENFCQTLRHAMHLAAPAGGRPGELVPTGRLHLATGPTWLRLPDRTTGAEVQFVLMPYPTPARYLTDEAAQAYQGFDEKNRNLMRAFTEWLRGVRTSPGFDLSLPTVLAAHVAMQGSDLSTRFRLTAEEDVLFEETSLLDEYAYVALGHIHRPQSLGGRRTSATRAASSGWTWARRPTTRASSCSRSARRGCAASRSSCRWKPRRCWTWKSHLPRRKFPRWNRTIPRRSVRWRASAAPIRPGWTTARRRCGGWKKSSRAGTTAR